MSIALCKQLLKFVVMEEGGDDGTDASICGTEPGIFFMKLRLLCMQKIVYVILFTKLSCLFSS